MIVGGTRRTGMTLIGVGSSGITTRGVGGGGEGETAGASGSGSGAVTTGPAACRASGGVATPGDRDAGACQTTVGDIGAVDTGGLDAGELDNDELDNDELDNGVLGVAFTVSGSSSGAGSLRLLRQRQQVSRSVTLGASQATQRTICMSGSESVTAGRARRVPTWSRRIEVDCPGSPDRSFVLIGIPPYTQSCVAAEYHPRRGTRGSPRR